MTLINSHSYCLVLQTFPLFKSRLTLSGLVVAVDHRIHQGVHIQNKLKLGTQTGSGEKIKDFQTRHHQIETLRNAIGTANDRTLLQGWA
jgi:hypothetical protein